MNSNESGAFCIREKAYKFILKCIISFEITCGSPCGSINSVQLSFPGSSDDCRFMHKILSLEIKSLQESSRDKKFFNSAFRRECNINF